MSLHPRRATEPRKRSRQKSLAIQATRNTSAGYLQRSPQVWPSFASENSNKLLARGKKRLRTIFPFKSNFVSRSIRASYQLKVQARKGERDSDWWKIDERLWADLKASKRPGDGKFERDAKIIRGQGARGERRGTRVGKKCQSVGENSYGERGRPAPVPLLN